MQKSTRMLVVGAVVLLALIHPAPSQKLFSILTPQISMHETDWEKELEAGIVALEQNCNDQQTMVFNKEKVTKELRNCLHPIITQDAMSHLDPFQKHLTHEELFRQIYIEPVCSKVSMSMACLKPHKKIIENCARDDGKAVQELLKSACKNNGTKLVEFVEGGGFDCITSRADEFANCFKTKNDKQPLASSVEVCSYFRSVRDCVIPIFFKCDRKAPGKVIRSLFEEVNLETNGRCLKDVKGQNSSPTYLPSLWTTLPPLLVSLSMSLGLRL